MKTVIFDIDGTLAEVEHRRHFIRNGNKDWKSFLEAAHSDPVIEPISNLCKIVSKEVTVVCCTGRGEGYRTLTENWLRKHKIPYVKLYMRPAGDERADHVVKLDLLHKIRSDGFEPFLAIEDRASVVSMWRQNGITCLQCSDWDETKSLAGTSLDILIGPAKAGKTVYAKENYPQEAVLSMREIGQSIQPSIHFDRKRDDIAAAIRGIAQTRLSHGLSTTIDATATRKKERTQLASVGLPNAKVRYIVLNKSVKDKLAECFNDAEKALVLSTEESFNSQLRDILSGDNLAVEILDLRHGSQKITRT